MKLLHFIVTFLFMFWPATATLNASAPTTLETTTATTTTTIGSVDTANDDDTSPLPTAAKLVRFRRQPPVTIIKHIVRSSKRTKPRRRIKRPKVRYGAASYGYDEQLPHSKSQYTSSLAAENPLFSFDELQKYNLDAAEFDLPPSSYEAQSMDLDFYSHSSDQSSYHNIPSVQAPADDYSSFNYEPDVQTSYTYKPASRKPHQKYGVPKHLEYSTDFKSNSDFYTPTDYLNSYQTQSSSAYSTISGGGDDGQFHTFNAEAHPQPTSLAHIPSTQYGVPTTDSHTSHSYSSQTKQHTPPASTPDSYTIYDKRLPNTGYDQNFKDLDFNKAPPSPPHHTPSQPVSDIQITYSPTYEIDVVSPSNSKPDLHSQPGNFAEPPVHPAPNPTPAQFAPTAQGLPPGPIDDYLPPSHELPLNPHHKQPAYDFPKSSYEVPIYDPIPFDASNNEELEFYPPNQYDPPARPVDIIDHPPQPTDDLPKDTHVSESDVSATTKFRRTRKRQRHPAMKHILDVPELKNAFEAAKKGHRGSTDADVNASTNVENKQKFVANSAEGTNDNNYYSATWNPMRVRTAASTPKAAITPLRPVHNETTSTPGNKPKPYFKSRTRTPPTDATLPLTANDSGETASKISIISIEKSRSQSYYDGTLAPPILTMSNMYNSRLNKFKTPTRRPAQSQSSSTQNPQKDATTVRHSTKSNFDTTHFKTPQNDRQLRPGLSNAFAQNLPRNHKLF